MAYVNPDTLQEVSNILDDLDPNVINDLFRTQITDESSYITIPVNHFEPLYQSYRAALEIETMDEDDLTEIKDRFRNICLTIIQLIQSKYGLSLDLDWIEIQYGDLPAVTLAFYRFFVLDLFYILIGVFNNYISKNIDELNETFSDVSQNRDVSTLTNLKTMDPKYAIIASSIYDITDYIFSNLDNDSFFEYIAPDYLPAQIINELGKKLVITGDFTRRFADIYRENLELRSKVGFELIYRIKERGYLSYNSVIVNSVDLPIDREQEVTPATEAATDIDSDADSI